MIKLGKYERLAIKVPKEASYDDVEKIVDMMLGNGAKIVDGVDDCILVEVEQFRVEDLETAGLQFCIVKSRQSDFPNWHRVIV